MRQTKVLICLLLLVLSTNVIRAQFKLSGELRPRTEYSHGYNTLADEDQNPSLFTSQRTRLNFAYKDSLLESKVSLQDVRLWGSQPQLVGNEDFATSIHQAWVKIALPRELYLKAGRQEVVYDNHRIFGNVGWAQQSRSHDMAILKYNGKFQVDLGLAYNQDANRSNSFYTGPDGYKALQFIWMHKDFANLDMSFLLLNNGVPYTESTGPAGNLTEQGIRYSQTFGPYLNYDMNNIDISGSFYYQMGKDAVGNDKSAFELYVLYSQLLSKNLKLKAGYEILSGTDYDETEENHSFTPLYGTNHKFNGHMDYFYVGNHINSVGLHDMHFGMFWSNDGFSLGGTAHMFRSYAEIAPNTDKYLGLEFDFSVGYQYNENIGMKAGYSHLLPSESMETLKGGSKDAIHNWAYLMLTVKPLFFSSK
jgi:hypothetical protein